MDTSFIARCTFCGIMIVNVELMAFIKRPEDLPRVFSKEVPDQTSVKDLMDILGFNSKEIRIMQFFISKNGTKESGVRAKKRDILSDGDSLFVTLPIGGG